MGHNPDSVSSVWGSDTASWNNKRLNFVVLAFQRKTDTLELHSVVERQDASRVLKQDPFVVTTFNNGKSLRPEPAVICRAKSLSGHACGLTRDASGE